MSDEDRERAAKYADSKGRAKLGVKPTAPKPPKRADVQRAAKARQEAKDKNGQ